METLRRRRSSAADDWITCSPSTWIAPSWTGSSPLMHLRSVLFPDPDGPHMTTTSPLAMVREQSRRTRWSPNHLLTDSTEIIGRPALRDVVTLVRNDMTSYRIGQPGVPVLSFVSCRHVEIPF